MNEPFFFDSHDYRLNIVQGISTFLLFLKCICVLFVLEYYPFEGVFRVEELFLKASIFMSQFRSSPSATRFYSVIGAR